MVFFIFTSASIAFAQESTVTKQLPVLKTKQSIKNIRYISQDGKVTYYQKSSGQLQYSTNFDFVNVMNGAKNSNYVLTVSEKHQKLGIEVVENPYKDFNWQRDHDLYLTGYKKNEKPQKIGEGTSLAFHQDPGVITYFKPSRRAIVVKRGETEKRIKIVNDNNPFFIPQVIAISPSDIIYTDINKEGYHAIILYNLLDQSFEVLYKAKYLSMDIKICRHKDFLVAGLAPNAGYEVGTKIIMTPLFRGGMAKNWDQLYASNTPDILNMACRGEYVYFLKTKSMNGDLNLLKSSIYKLKLDYEKRHQPEEMAYFEKATSLFELGNLLITSVNGKYYIVDGELNKESEKL